jgi:hypothetical protein
MKEKNKKYPEGHFIGMWMGIGIAIFSGLGIPLSIISETSGLIGVGPALGVAIGLAIGSAVESKYNNEGRIRPLTEVERKKKKIGILLGIVLLAIGALTFLFIYLNR